MEKKAESTEGSDETLYGLLDTLIKPTIKLIKKIATAFLPFIKLSKASQTLFAIFLILLLIRLNFISIGNILYTLVILLIIDLISTNFEFFIKILRPEKLQKADFIDKIDSKTFKEAANFIRETNLTDLELIQILKSKVGNNPEIARAIINFQTWGEPVVEYLLASKKMKNWDRNTFAFFIIYTDSMLSKKTFMKCEKMIDGYVRGGFLIKNKAYIEKKGLLQNLFSPFLVIFNLFIIGVKNDLIRIISFVLSAYLIFFALTQIPILSTASPVITGLFLAFPLILVWLFLGLGLMILFVQAKNMIYFIIFELTNFVYKKETRKSIKPSTTLA